MLRMEYIRQKRELYNFKYGKETDCHTNYLNHKKHVRKLKHCRDGLRKNTPGGMGYRTSCEILIEESLEQKDGDTYRLPQHTSRS